MSSKPMFAILGITLTCVWVTTASAFELPLSHKTGVTHTKQNTFKLHFELHPTHIQQTTRIWATLYSSETPKTMLRWCSTGFHTEGTSRLLYKQCVSLMLFYLWLIVRSLAKKFSKKPFSSLAFYISECNDANHSCHLKTMSIHTIAQLQHTPAHNACLTTYQCSLLTQKQCLYTLSLSKCFWLSPHTNILVWIWH